MILPDKLALISSVLGGRIGIDASDLKAVSTEGLIPTPDESRFVGTFEPVDPENPRAGRKPYRTTSDGTAIIPIIGSLVNRGSFMDVLSGILSYEILKRDIGMAASDKAVKAIVLDIDSPGGEAVGAFEAAEVVADAAKVKQVTAVANGLCCSAAYAIASAATRRSPSLR
jgi:ClpP class serine protease